MGRQFIPRNDYKYYKNKTCPYSASWKKEVVHSQFHDTCPVKSSMIDATCAKHLEKNLKKMNPRILRTMLSENKNVPIVNKLIWPVARGSVLHKQLQGFWMTETNFLYLVS